MSRRRLVPPGACVALSVFSSGFASQPPDSFASQEELRDFLQERQDVIEAEEAERAKNDTQIEEIISTGTFVSSSITNTQVAGVDEGGIVKASGEFLVILRRGRLFTVSTAGGGLRPVDQIDAFPPGMAGDYYDEMLVVGDRVLVLGYGNGEGTEINRFRLLRDGRLKFEDSYVLSSDDYYSSENYATRLVGDRLVLYSPLYLGSGSDPTEVLPGMRRRISPDDDVAMTPTANARDIYVAPGFREGGGRRVGALHTVTTCDTTAKVLDCKSVGVLGPWGRTFYVSESAIYLWMQSWGGPGAQEAFVYRIPFSSLKPAVARARGAPPDQFSFSEDLEDRVLNVVVQAEGGGDAMWVKRFGEGGLSLLRLPLASFGDGAREVGAEHYRSLPSPDGEEAGYYSIENRFVGDYLFYGVGHGWGDEEGVTDLVATHVRDGENRKLPLRSALGRIEVIGGDAMAVGEREEDIVFTTIKLSDYHSPRLGEPYVYRSASEAETRSHAFFYRPINPDGSRGMLGLPVSRPGRPGWNQLWEDPAAMVFLNRAPGRLSHLGDLEARAGADDEADNCQASCDDWYGNARPIFYRGRIFALMGYEIVEGVRTREGIRERRRVNFAPAAQP